MKTLHKCKSSVAILKFDLLLEQVRFSKNEHRSKNFESELTLFSIKNVGSRFSAEMMISELKLNIIWT